MFKALLNLIFPSICYACGKSISESVQNICIACRNDLPRIKFNKLSTHPVEKVLWGRLELERATSFLKFEKHGKTQQLLHALKYQGIHEVGETLGELAALEVKESKFFKEIDLLLPIPIHKIKLKKRGYNQSEYIAKGIANITSIPVNTTALKKEINTASQTRKNRFERFDNVNQTFTITNKEALQNKHILLIDDVITTGSTIEACGRQLKTIEGVQLSLLTIAFTY